MAEWNKNNLAHTKTYLAMRILAQTTRKFSAAGALPIRELNFWVVGESAQMRKARARVLASQTHNLFVMQFGTRLETGFSNAGAVGRLVDVLIDGDKTVCELADAADEAYDFSGPVV